ncbi:MAG: hypothetical protein GOU99_02640, partial [Candidatus Altiarchaeota archaeon]|nr:hypothetical protein [Candidatus Altiarchaeota archaeon]
DIDLFLMFNPADKLEDKLDLLKKIAGKLGPIRLEYAQHPYVSTEFGGYEIELVPAYKTKPTQLISAADRSPWHVDWVKKQSETAKQDAMLLKAFFNGIGVYGADQKVQGFSGYALEVIAVRFGFRGILEKNLSWPLAMQDPVDSNRNILASVSKASFMLLDRAIDAFLEKPSLKFFFPNPTAVLDKLPVDEAILLILFDKQDKPTDVQWGQLRRKAKSMLNQAKSNRIKIIESRFWVGDMNHILVKLELEPEITLMGPPLGHSGHCERFRKKHKHVFEKEGKLWARETAPDALAFFKQFGTVLTKEKLQKKYDKMSKQEKQEASSFFVKKDSWLS